jgi:hypothetical protein
MLCYAMLCYAMLCYAMLCYAMLCYAMLCYADAVIIEQLHKSGPFLCEIHLANLLSTHVSHTLSLLQTQTKKESSRTEVFLPSDQKKKTEAAHEPGKPLQSIVHLVERTRDR